MGAWSAAQMDVEVDYVDFERAREEAIERGESTDTLTVWASVDIDEALAEASIEQLREALGREAPGYTADEIEAIRDCFAALCRGDAAMAQTLLPRVFEHQAQIQAAEDAIRSASVQRAA